jgi:hypothetical protein
MLILLFIINFTTPVYLITIFIKTIKQNHSNPHFIEIGALGFFIALLLLISTVLFYIIVR